MKYLTMLLFLLFLFSCQDEEVVQKETRNNGGEHIPEESPSIIYIEESDWDSFFKNIPSGEDLKNESNFFIKNHYMKRPFKNAGEKNGFFFRVGFIINGEIENDLLTVGSLNVLFKEDNYYTITAKSMDRIEGKPIWQLKDITSFTTSIQRTGFFEATDTPNSYPIFNKEHNIYGVFDWDSPLIAPDTFIPAEKVIIINPETLDISVIDNEDRSYVVFIDAAFLE